MREGLACLKLRWIIDYRPLETLVQGRSVSPPSAVVQRRDANIVGQVMCTKSKSRIIGQQNDHRLPIRKEAKIKVLEHKIDRKLFVINYLALVRRAALHVSHVHTSFVGRSYGPRKPAPVQSLGGSRSNLAVMHLEINGVVLVFDGLVLLHEEHFIT